MDACEGGDPSDRGACANEVETAQLVVAMDGVGAATCGLLLDDHVQRGGEVTELDSTNTSDMDTTPTGDINIADVQNTNGSFIPDAPLEMRPRIRLEFVTLDDAFHFYDKYARHCGFSVRKDTIQKLKLGTISRCILRCSKDGSRNKKSVDIKLSKHKAAPLTSCCPAKISLNLKVQKNTYEVTQFVEAHDHLLCAPTKTHWLRSHKRLATNNLNVIATFKASGTGVTHSRDFMRVEVGGPHMGFLERDFRNALLRKRQIMFGSDVDVLLQYFQTKQKEDSQFTYEISVDENMQLQSCFWVDQKSKNDYMLFNDVVCFDTTYKTNEHDMPFGVFVGVNHHMQTVLFGAGLIFGETIEDFKWLFQAWLDAMSGVQPKTIITDQDPNIKQAITTIFPNAHHILCLWHINKELSDKLSHIIHKNPTFIAAWNYCLYGSSGIKEYEKTWSTMIEEFNLQGNSWLCHMYDIRQMWIPAYTKGMFFAGMRTTNQNKSVNAFFDAFVTHRSSLMDFANGYEKALEKSRKYEANADFRNLNSKPVLKTKCIIEAAMAKIYTLKVFGAFQQEVEDNLYYMAKLCKTEGVIQQWHVLHFNKRGDQKGKMVTWNEDQMVASCPCMKFESIGIVCRHILTIFRFKRILTMPPKHLLARWTRNAISQFKQPQDLISTNATQSIMLRSYVLSNYWSFLRAEALSNPAAYEVVKEFMEKAKATVLELPKNDTIENAAIEQLGIHEKASGDVGDNFNLIANEVDFGVGPLHRASSGTISSQSSQAGGVLSAPVQSLHKVRSSGRMKGHLEVQHVRKRLCRGCHKFVVGHDKRTCPELKELPPTGEREDNSEVHTIRGRGRGRHGGVK